MSTSAIDEVLQFWFGDLDEHGRAADGWGARWWKKDAAFDEEIRSRFGALHAAVAAGQRTDWLATARGRLAYIIVLDQFSRNMLRDTPAMYACDADTQAVVSEGIELGHDQELRCDERAFFYMPLMHSESVELHEQCVAAFQALFDATPEHARAGLDANLSAAAQHRDIVVRFGRFPHRNAIVGRESTAEELAFLTQPGSSF